MSPATIERDGQFATAVETLEAQVRVDLRELALRRQEHGTPKPTKRQVTHAGTLIQTHTVEPLPFMQHQGWKPYHVLEAIEILAGFPKSEHSALNTLLDRPFVPPHEGLNVLRNLRRHTPAQRQHIYSLDQSTDPRERSLATTLAAQKVPEPDPLVLLAAEIIQSVDRNLQRIRAWRNQYPQEIWPPEVEAVETSLAQTRECLQALATQAKARHQERIKRHADIFQP